MVVIMWICECECSCYNGSGHLDAVGLDQRDAVLERRGRDVIPGGAVGEAQVHMRTGQGVHVKPYVVRQAPLDQVLCRTEMNMASGLTTIDRPATGTGSVYHLSL